LPQDSAKQKDNNWSLALTVHLYGSEMCQRRSTSKAYIAN
jgi:hypothetical protein